MQQLPLFLKEFITLDAYIVCITMLGSNINFCGDLLLFFLFFLLSTTGKRSNCKCNNQKNCKYSSLFHLNFPPSLCLISILIRKSFSLLFTRCATSNASRHFESPLAMRRDAFKPKHASSVSISGVIDTGVNSNSFSAYLHKMAMFL